MSKINVLKMKDLKLTLWIFVAFLFSIWLRIIHSAVNTIDNVWFCIRSILIVENHVKYTSTTIERGLFQTSCFSHNNVFIICFLRFYNHVLYLVIECLSCNIFSCYFSSDEMLNLLVLFIHIRHMKTVLKIIINLNFV